jgi:hypothetical protein
MYQQAVFHLFCILQEASRKLSLVQHHYDDRKKNSEIRHMTYDDFQTFSGDCRDNYKTFAVIPGDFLF